MWICLKDAFVSVVAYQPGPEDKRQNHLLVRARLAGDLERLLGSSIEVGETAAADYRFRAIVSADDFFAAMLSAISAIDYRNFKDAAAATSLRIDPFRDMRLQSYHRVGEVLAGLQTQAHGRPYEVRYAEAQRELSGFHRLSDEELAFGDVCTDCGEAIGYCQCYDAGVAR